MRLHALVALVAAGCGRVAFDDRSDGGPIGHDEDGDGIADIDDVCPHLAGSQLDSDQDGVGDDCDPEPGNPRQRIAQFVTFEGGVHPFTTDGGGVFAAQPDALRLTGRDGQLILPMMIGDIRLAVGADLIAATGGDVQHQLYLIAGRDSGAEPVDYIELNQTMGVNQAAITHYDGSGYTPLVSQPLATGVHAGEVTLQGTFTATRTVLDAGWPGEPYHLETPSTYVGTQRVLFGVNNCDVDIRWFIAIVTQ